MALKSNLPQWKNENHGPFSFDAVKRRHILTLYRSSSIDLCKILSKLLIRIAAKEQNFLNSYNACRLIALDKRPGFNISALVRSEDELYVEV